MEDLCNHKEHASWSEQNPEVINRQNWLEEDVIGNPKCKDMTGLHHTPLKIKINM